MAVLMADIAPEIIVPPGGMGRYKHTGIASCATLLDGRDMIPQLHDATASPFETYMWPSPIGSSTTGDPPGTTSTKRRRLMSSDRLGANTRAYTAALEYANRIATDDATFVQAFLSALNMATDLTAPTEALRGFAPMSFMELRTPSPHLLERPIYVRNARELYSLRNNSVVDGRSAQASDFPECVAVLCRANDTLCTGTLVARNAVLTAAHCTCTENMPVILFGTSVNSPVKEVPVQRVEVHNGFDANKYAHDIALLILDRDITDIPPANFAPVSAINTARYMMIVGYGATDVLGTRGEGIRRYATVPVASTKCASMEDQQHFGCTANLEMVAGPTAQAGGACISDSGGPCYVQWNNSWQLAAITSRSIQGYDSPCGGGSVNVRVDRYRTWLRSVPGVHW